MLSARASEVFHGKLQFRAAFLNAPSLRRVNHLTATVALRSCVCLSGGSYRILLTRGSPVPVYLLHECMCMIRRSLAKLVSEMFLLLAFHSLHHTARWRISEVQAESDAFCSMGVTQLFLYE